MSVDESGWTANGVGADADGLLCDIAGSEGYEKSAMFSEPPRNTHLV
jgi:hypothetical protein